MTKLFTYLLQTEIIPSNIFHDTKTHKPIIFSELDFSTMSQIQSTIYQDKTNAFHQNVGYSYWYTYLYRRDISIKDKYCILDNILCNKFATNASKDVSLTIFSNIQKMYRGFSLLAKLYRFKNAQLQVDTDMFLTPIKEYDPKVFSLIEGKNKYLFSLTDIVNMFAMSLLKLSFFMVSPQSIKNPYTNTCLSKSTLYNLYFFLKNRLARIPEYIECFFSTQFNIEILSNRHLTILQDMAIDYYVDKAYYTELTCGIIFMLENFNTCVSRIYIHPSFPRETLCNIMKPYLKLYYKSKYSASQHLTTYYTTTYKNYLIRFFKESPKFGRLRPNSIVTNSSLSHAAFYMDHQPFYKISNYYDKNVFLHSHMSYGDRPPVDPISHELFSQLSIHRDEDGEERNYDTSQSMESEDEEDITEHFQRQSILNTDTDSDEDLDNS